MQILPEKLEATAEPNLPPCRPQLLTCTCLAEMFGHFERLFLGADGLQRNHESRCGLCVTAIDHNFFHMVKMSGPQGESLFMLAEKEKIRACREGFSDYRFAHNDHRGKYLGSALDTLLDPDEMWEGCQALKSAKYSLVKEYDSKPYPFTVFLVGEREGGLLTLITSFPCTRRDSKKWRKGTLAYSRNTEAAR